MRFVDLFDLTRAIELDELVDDSRQANIISKMGDPAIALKVMKSGLWYSYMFNRYAIPLYASHVFRAVSSFDRVDDSIGAILAGVTGVIKGEIFNNNIYGQPRECHSHYVDMERAYLAAGGDPEYVKNISAAETLTPYAHYASRLRALLDDPLATFILISANEKSTPHFFEAVNRHLTSNPKFDLYRQFVNRHIELDRGEHSSVTMGWLTKFVEHSDYCKLPSFYVHADRALKQVIEIIKLSQGKR